MKPDQHVSLPSPVKDGVSDISQAYTILESSTKAVFLHVTTSEGPGLFWGNILKSNSNGTYYGISIENVNRNDQGFVDFEKMIGLDGIALINVVSNPHEAVFTGQKELQSRITHNDGMFFSLSTDLCGILILLRWYMEETHPSTERLAG